jgi:hypothetical protein
MPTSDVGKLEERLGGAERRVDILKERLGYHKQQLVNAENREEQVIKRIVRTTACAMDEQKQRWSEEKKELETRLEEQNGEMEQQKREIELLQAKIMKLTEEISV